MALAKAVSRPADLRCGHSGDVPTELKLSSSTAWRLCWRIDPSVGLTLSDVTYQPPRPPSISVLRSASLAQIEVAYDDGRHIYRDLPGFGVLTTSQRPADCPNGILVDSPKFLKAVCLQLATDVTAAWSDYDFGTGNHSIVGSCVTLSTETPTDWYTYTTRWRFCADGAINASVGASGQLAPALHGGSVLSNMSTLTGAGAATGHYHDVFWRIQPAVSRTIDALFEVNAVRVGSETHSVASVIGKEYRQVSGGSRFWLIRPEASPSSRIGYSLSIANMDPDRRPLPMDSIQNSDVFVTQDKACEQLASSNKSPGCPTALSGYVSDEIVTEPVIWIQSSFHHVPRDEDAPVTDEHWLSFDMEPRNVTSHNLLEIK